MTAPALVARRPILDRTGTTVAYRLPWRSDSGELGSLFRAVDVSGLDERAPCLLPVSAARPPIGFDGDGAVRTVEIAADLVPGPALLNWCDAAREAGWSLLLGDGDAFLQWCLHADLFDGCLIDIGRHPGMAFRRLADELFAHTATIGGGEAVVIARNVTSAAQRRDAERAGHRLFEGTWWLQEAGTAPPVRGDAALALVRAVNRDDWDAAEIEAVLRTDPTLADGLLRQVGTAASGLRTDVTSIQHAVVLLGERNVRRWANVAATARLAHGRIRELLVAGVARARHAELLCELAIGPVRGGEGFIAGLLSVLPTIVGRSAAELVGGLPLAPDVVAGIVDHNGPFGQVLALVVAVESGGFAAADLAIDALGLDPVDVATASTAALRWTVETLSGQVSSPSGGV